MSDDAELAGPNLALGVALDDFKDSDRVVGHVDGEEVLLVRRGTQFFAVSAQCTHYHGPLVDGLVVGDTIRCPWHHACFDLRTGEAVRAPAFDSLSCWTVEIRDSRVFVSGKKDLTKTAKAGKSDGDAQRVVIVGGGAAGFAAAEMLRRE
jgi:nitrite reductase/ring-hydroxylating ferredoxin subunit